MPAIGHSTFRYRTNLLELDLSHNRIEHLIDSDFRGLSKLQRLNLSHNQLTGNTIWISDAGGNGLVLQT